MTTPRQLDARRDMRAWLGRGNRAEKEPLIRYIADLIGQGIGPAARAPMVAARFRGIPIQTVRAAESHAQAFRQTERDPQAQASRVASDITRLQTLTVGTEESEAERPGYSKWRAIVEYDEPGTRERARFMVILEARTNATERELDSNVNAMLTSFLNTSSSKEANARYNALRSGTATTNYYRQD